MIVYCSIKPYLISFIFSSECVETTRMSTRAKKHKWMIDFNTRSKSDRQVSLPSPVGFCDVSTAVDRVRDTDSVLIVKKSWDIALGPIKQVPMNVFIMWMAGSSISIFPIMMVGMMFFRPIQALIGIQNTFNMIEGGQAPIQKLTYLVGNLVCLGLAVYKCQVMGLLPSHASDWLAFVEPQQRMEWSGGGIMM